jgi:GNAT superfamily N-acetyltransferase
MTIHPLTPAAVHQALWLPDLEWGRAQWHAHTPYTHAVHAEHYDDVVGVAGLVLHGDTALLDLLYTHPDERRFGAGTAMVKALLQAADAHGTTTVANVPPESAPFLERHGFRVEEELLRCEGNKFINATLDEVINMEPHHLLAMLHLDRRATGEDRRTWLLEHSYLGSVYEENGRVRGFSLPLLREALIVADAPEVGLELQRWVLPTQDHLLLPKSNVAAVKHLADRGNTNAVELVRMVRGPGVALKGELVFGHP